MTMLITHKGRFSVAPLAAGIGLLVAALHADMLAAPTAAVILYHTRDVVPVKTRVRYTTLIVLPKDEQILDYTCGDKDFWVVNGNQNLAFVKPAKGGARTNLNLVTASGNIYSFVLSEVSETPRAEPDLKLFIELADATMTTAQRSEPKFYSAQDMEALKQQLAAAKDDTQRAQKTCQDTVDRSVRQFVSNVRFAYRFEAGKKPFYLRAMYHDDRFTYIQARPEEAPALFEVRDGKPMVVNFQYRDGVYQVNKILDQGYLVIGKQKLHFSREE